MEKGAGEHLVTAAQQCPWGIMNSFLLWANQEGDQEDTRSNLLWTAQLKYVDKVIKQLKLSQFIQSQRTDDVQLEGSQRPMVALK